MKRASRDNALKMLGQRLRKPRGILEEKNADVVDVRDLDPGRSESGLQCKLHGLLAAPDNQMPGSRMMVTLGFRQDQPSLSQIAPGHLPARHSSMTSPGRKLGFNTQ